MTTTTNDRTETLAERLYIGRTPEGERVWVTVQLRHAAGRDRETINHETISEWVSLSISGHTRSKNARIDDGGGQCVEIVERARSQSPYPRKLGIFRLCEIWGEWHNNGMTAACAHQTPTSVGPGERLTAPPCPETGYKYGDAWLVRPLPDEIITELRSLVAALAEGQPTEDPWAARMAADGITARVAWTPARTSETEGGDNWRVTFRRDDQRMIASFFTGPGLRETYPDGPTPHMVLDTLLTEAADYVNARDFEEWAHEFGYDLGEPSNRREASRIWREVERQTVTLQGFLGDLYDPYVKGENV